MKMKWKDLFDYVSKKVNFRYKEGKPKTTENVIWACYGDLGFVRKFCKKHGIPISSVISRLNETGGYCDCEVLFNSIEHIDENEEILGEEK